MVSLMNYMWVIVKDLYIIVTNLYKQMQTTYSVDCKGGLLLKLKYQRRNNYSIIVS